MDGSRFCSVRSRDLTEHSPPVKPHLKLFFWAALGPLDRSNLSGISQQRAAAFPPSGVSKSRGGPPKSLQPSQIARRRRCVPPPGGAAAKRFPLPACGGGGGAFPPPGGAFPPLIEIQMASPATYAPRRWQQQKRQTFQEDNWVRADGRGFHQCRPAFLRTGAATAASGSAYAEFGSTKVIVSVFGPRESKKAMKYSDIGRLNCNVSFTTFSTPTRGQESNHKEFSSMLHKALEGAVILDTFPKTTVDVFALVLESGGSDLPVIISCASLALADAGIMMYDLVTSVSVTCIGKRLIIDPTAEEEECQDASLMLTCMPSRNEITQFTLTGEWSTPRIHEATELCLDACLKLGEIMRACLREAASSN